MNVCFATDTHYICLQSMDGQLAVYEHESFAFSRFLHNYLLPGPIHYSAKLDAFITCNSSFEVECYKCASVYNSSIYFMTDTLLSLAGCFHHVQLFVRSRMLQVRIHMHLPYVLDAS
jgi:hypothetical protein